MPAPFHLNRSTRSGFFVPIPSGARSILVWHPFPFYLFPVHLLRLLLSVPVRSYQKPPETIRNRPQNH